MITIQYVYKSQGGKVDSYKVVAIENFNELIFLN